jgi:aldehyde:ferredoxin oxidoreductase
MSDQIKVRLRKILATHKPPPLPEGVAEKIEAILEAAEAREGVEDFYTAMGWDNEGYPTKEKCQELGLEQSQTL